MMRAKLCFGAAFAALSLSACRGPDTIVNNNLNLNALGAFVTLIDTVGDCQRGMAIRSLNGDLSLRNGESIDLDVVTASQNGCMPTQSFDWSANPAGVVNIVTIDDNTGRVTAIAVGQVEVCATGRQDPTQHLCVIITVTSGPSNPPTISPIASISTGTGCSRTFQGSVSPAGTAGTWSITSMTGFTGATVNATTGAGSGIPLNAAGSFVLTFDPENGDPVNITVQVTAVNCTNPTINPIASISTGNGCARTFQGVVSPAAIAGTWSISSVTGFTGVAVNASTGAGSGIPQNASGSFVLTFTPADGNPVSLTVQVTAANCTNPTVTSTPSFSVANCSSFQSTWNLTVTVNGSAATGTWSSSNTSVATVNASTGAATLTGTAGVANITVQTSSGSAVTTITVTQCSSTAVTVDVTPATFSLTVGQGSVTFTCVVTAPAGQSTACTWSSNFVGTSTSAGACLTLSPQGSNQVIVTPIAGCTQQIEIRGTAVANTSVSDVSVGSTSSGNVVCTITWNGTTTGTITVPVGGNTTVTASCTNQFGASFIPYWYTQLYGSSVIRISGSTTVITIGSSTWPAGPQATLTGTASGTDAIVVQAAISDKTVLASRTVVVP